MLSGACQFGEITGACQLGEITATRARAVTQLAEIDLSRLEKSATYREAAETLKVPMGTLTSRLARGREALQALLGGVEGTRA